MTKFSPYFSFTVYCFYTKISSFTPALSIRIALDCFYLLIFYSEKFSTDVCRLPYAVNVNLNLSINYNYSDKSIVLSKLHSKFRMIRFLFTMCVFHSMGLSMDSRGRVKVKLVKIPNSVREVWTTFQEIHSIRDL